ncbi:hypothetical protein D3C78_1172070 [compost metagenome]
MAMYIQLIGRMLALPQGAALTAVFCASGPSSSTTGWLATKGARCAFTPIGPMPGPPPPWGMQKVLCRLRCATSAPMSAGRVRPTWAFMFAPSMYTWPPWPCTAAQILRMPSSYTPWVDG